MIQLHTDTTTLRAEMVESFGQVLIEILDR
jgi:hypothetical protein